MADFNIQDFLRKIKIQKPDQEKPLTPSKPVEGEPEICPLYGIKTPDGDGFVPKDPPKVQPVYGVFTPPSGSEADKPVVQPVYAAKLPDEIAEKIKNPKPSDQTPVETQKPTSLWDKIKILFGFKK